MFAALMMKPLWTIQEVRDLRSGCEQDSEKHRETEAFGPADKKQCKCRFVSENLAYPKHDHFHREIEDKPEDSLGLSPNSSDKLICERSRSAVSQVEESQCVSLSDKARDHGHCLPSP